MKILHQSVGKSGRKRALIKLTVSDSFSLTRLHYRLVRVYCQLHILLCYTAILRDTLVLLRNDNEVSDPENDGDSRTDVTIRYLKLR